MNERLHRRRQLDLKVAPGGYAEKLARLHYYCSIAGLVLIFGLLAAEFIWLFAL